MSIVMLSRLQFAAATLFHFLFVSLSLGLPVLIAILETRYVRTGNPDYKKHAQFWGKILILNFAMGVVTGLTLEFQFGTNWSRFSRYVGDVFGPLLAIEATTSFFLESTFIAVWAFGWNKISPKLHALCIWLVALAGLGSAVWILMANAFMHAPVGYVIRNGRAELTDFWALVFSNFAWHQIFHTVAAGFVISGFFMMGISAAQILRNRNPRLFAQSFKLSAVFSFIFSIIVVAQGHTNGEAVAQAQPTKLAAMEPTWETTSWAPIYLFCIPDTKQERNLYQIGKLPGALSVLAFRSPSATVKGLKDFPTQDRPPVLWTFATFRIMIVLGLVFILMSFLGWAIRNNPQKHRRILRILAWSIPLPFLAAEMGWIMTEVGRQPWVVYNVLRTSDAASTLSKSQVWPTLIAFIIVYGFLGIVAFYLMAREVRKGIKE
ncbi:MAG: cytochrome ubiquinol oxidase subunit I [Phycisphaerae bacterium]